MTDLRLGDCTEVLRTLPAGSVHTCVTSPPYFGLRDYGADGQIGLERTPDEYVARMVAVFREVRRVLRDDATLWLNLGDSYATNPGNGRGGEGSGLTKGGKTPHRSGIDKSGLSGLKTKDLIGIPWMVAFALRADGWYLRSDIIWHKPNPMPESVRDRPTKAHEYLFLLSKSATYHYDADAVRETASEIQRRPNVAMQATAPVYDAPEQSPHTFGPKGERYGTYRNRRSVWTVATRPFKGWTQTSRLARAVQGVLSGDMTHRVSRDCPLHADRPGPVGNEPCGGHGGDPCGHNGRNGCRPAPGRQDGPDTTARQDGRCFEGRSSDSPLPSCSPTATGRSNRTSRTGLDPATTPPCRLSARKTGRTGDTPASPGSSGRCHDTCGCNTSADDCGDSRDSRTTGRTADIPLAPELFGASIESLGHRGCICEFYTTITEKSSHFATFPPALIEPCILAGCPEGGTVLDPFAGAFTTGTVAKQHGRSFIGIELNPAYLEMGRERLANT